MAKRNHIDVQMILRLIGACYPALETKVSPSKSEVLEGTETVSEENEPLAKSHIDKDNFDSFSDISFGDKSVQSCNKLPSNVSKKLTVNKRVKKTAEKDDLKLNRLTLPT